MLDRMRRRSPFDLTGAPHVVIVGGGFGGLHAARAFKNQWVRVTLVDRRNHHVFQPLLYQVATASLSPADIASPIRSILRKLDNVHVELGAVTAIDLEHREIALGEERIRYDYLILAAGATHSYFGHDEWEDAAPGLKTLEDALEIRRRILLAYEAAERAHDPVTREKLMTFVVVGGGPTGVELAGAMAEIARHSLTRDFDNINPSQASIHLIEAGPRILATFPEKLSRAAANSLTKLGVNVRAGAAVTAVDPDGVTLAGGERIAAGTVLWAAGVRAASIGRALGVDLDRAGRVPVQPDLTLAGHPEVSVIGDLANLPGKNGKPLPGVAQVAMQEGDHAGSNVLRQISGHPGEPFQYKDLGNMATIGRNNAIADIGPLKISGFPAWLVWTFIHILNLIGFRNRVVVMTQWVWAYVTFQRGARLITSTAKSRDTGRPGTVG